MLNKGDGLIDRCAKDVTAGVSSLLKYIGTLKGLASVRDAVWDLLKEVHNVAVALVKACSWFVKINGLHGQNLKKLYHSAALEYLLLEQMKMGTARQSHRLVFRAEDLKSHYIYA